MNGSNRHKPRSRLAAKLLPLVGASLLLTACARTPTNGSDAGCQSYAEARLVMPAVDTVPGGKWGDWIADTDDRMTGACRG